MAQSAWAGLCAATALWSGIAGAQPSISLIIDDLGEQHLAGLRALRLPGPVAYAFLPGTPFSAEQAEQAYATGKEVLLHLPLEPAGSQRYPLSITLQSSRLDVAACLDTALASVPHVRGVNNHEGSLLTEHARPMDWLMAEVKLRPDLYFVDSRTSPRSVAYQAALAHGVPATERQVFLDYERDEAAIRQAFRRLIQRARRDERALAIGHPYPQTLKVLEEELPKLAQYGVRLVPPSELIRLQGGDSSADAGQVSLGQTPTTTTTGPERLTAR